MSPYILVVSNKQHKKPIGLYIQGDLMSGALVCSFDNGVFQEKMCAKRELDIFTCVLSAHKR